MGDRVFLQNPAGKGDSLQERVMCFNADTGKVIWEYRFNIYQSDVPPHRVGWASPVGDPTTGNIYALGVGGTLLALSKDGKPIWERSLGEEFGLWTTHGGRTVSPIIDGDLVIISGITENWGDKAERRFRFMAFDKKTGQTVWVTYTRRASLRHHLFTSCGSEHKRDSIVDCRRRRLRSQRSQGADGRACLDLPDEQARNQYGRCRKGDDRVCFS